MGLSRAIRSVLRRLRTFPSWIRAKDAPPAADLELAKIKLKQILHGRKEYEGLRSRLVYSDSEQVYWLRDSTEQEGPFCLVCFKQQHIAKLIPATSRGVFFCPIHELTFRTREYYRSLARNFPDS